MMALRHAVFCDEQGVPPELERDAGDAAALHVVAVERGRVVGTCRVLGDGPSVRLVTKARSRSATCASGSSASTPSAIAADALYACTRRLMC